MDGCNQTLLAATIPRVIVVDADDRVRESLCGLLGIGHRLWSWGATGQTADALDLAAAQHPDIVVIDPRLPENDGGMAFIQQLRDTVPGVRIIAMSRTDAELDADPRCELRWLRPQDVPAERARVGHPRRQRRRRDLTRGG